MHHFYSLLSDIMPCDYDYDAHIKMPARVCSEDNSSLLGDFPRRHTVAYHSVIILFNSSVKIVA